MTINWNFSRWLNSSLMIHSLLASVTLLIACLGWWTVTNIHCQVKMAVDSEHQSLALLERTAEIQASSTALTNECECAVNQVRSLRSKVPDSPDESTFLKQLSDVAVANNINVSDFRPGGVTDHGTFKELELRLRCAGIYSDLCKWLDELRLLPRMMRISQLSIMAPATAGSPCTIDLQFNLLFAIADSSKLANAVKP